MHRVCMIAFSYYPRDTRILREAEALGKNGIGVDVICLRAPGESKTERLGSVTAYRIMDGSGHKESMLRYLLLSLKFTLASLAELVRLSVKKRYSLVQVHNMPDYLVFAGAFHKVLGRAVVLDLHDLTVELFQTRCGHTASMVLMPFVRLCEKLSCAFADRVITTSIGFKRRLMDRGVNPDKIELVLNAADDSVFTGPAERKWEVIKDGPRLLYHGTVAPRFGIHVAVEAVDVIRRELPGVRFSIYGNYDPSYRNDLEALIKRLKLRDNVSLGGYLNVKEIVEAINASHMGVVPYLSDEFMNLALSTKTFEYVSMGMPVVAARLDSIKSIFSESSIAFFPPGQPKGLAERVFELCSKPEMRKSMAEKAFESYSKMAWPVMSSRYINLISSLITTGKDNGKHQCEIRNNNSGQE